MPGIGQPPHALNRRGAAAAAARQRRPQAPGRQASPGQASQTARARRNARRLWPAAWGWPFWGSPFWARRSGSPGRPERGSAGVTQRNLAAFPFSQPGKRTA